MGHEKRQKRLPVKMQGHSREHARAEKKRPKA